MKLLLIDENPFSSHDAQLLANELGIYSIHLFDNVAQAWQTIGQRHLSFDVALVRQADDPFSDLQQLDTLHRKLHAEHLLLKGAYSSQECQALLRAARTRKLPLLGILDVPLKRQQMLGALRQIPGFPRFATRD
ncbi:hypothetical protein D9M70_325640 [compost metagenome]